MRIGLRLIAIGAILIIVDFRVGDGPDLIPDVVGALLILFAVVTQLRGRHRRFDQAIIPACGLLATSVVLVADLSDDARMLVESLNGIAAGVAAALVFFGIADLAHDADLHGLGRDGTLAGFLNVIGAAIAAISGVISVLASSGSGSDDVEGSAPLVIVVVVIFLAIAIWMLTILFRAASQLPD